MPTKNAEINFILMQRASSIEFYDEVEHETKNRCCFYVIYHNDEASGAGGVFKKKNVL